MSDNLIESFEYYDYKPPISEDINRVGVEFPIIAYNEDIVTQPHKSLLIISGKVSVKQGSPAEELLAIDTKKLDFVNNGILNIFDRIDYFIGDNKIDSIRKPGISATMKGIASLKPNKTHHLAGWKLFDDCTSLINKDGYFSFAIPLYLIMGFFEDYKKFLYRIPQKLIFYRSTVPANNCFYSNEATYVVSVNIQEIVWRIPQVKFSIAYETQVRKEILKNTNYELFFRTWFYQNIAPPVGSTDYTWDVPVSYSKTKYVLIALQTDMHDKLGEDNSTFNFLDLENVQVLLNNNIYYPRERLNLKFAENKCGKIYQMFKAFKESYYSITNNNNDDDPTVDYNDFITKYPILVIDCSYQPAVIKESLINIKIIFNWRKAIPNKTIVHCVMIMDQKAVYNPLSNTVLH